MKKIILAILFFNLTLSIFLFISYLTHVMRSATNNNQEILPEPTPFVEMKVEDQKKETEGCKIVDECVDGFDPKTGKRIGSCYKVRVCNDGKREILKP